MDKIYYWKYCNFIQHSYFNSTSLFSYFCHNCKRRLCLDCFKKHCSIFSSHNIEEIKNDRQKLEIKLEELQNENFGLKMDAYPNNFSANNIINSFADKLKDLDKIYKKIIEEKNKTLIEYLNNKKDIQEQLENQDNKMNIDEETQNIRNSYDELTLKIKSVNDLFDSLGYLVIKNSENNPNQKFNVCSNINNIEFSNTSQFKNININIKENKELNITDNDETNNVYSEIKPKEVIKINDLLFPNENENLDKISLNESIKEKVQINQSKLIQNRRPKERQIQYKHNIKLGNIFKNMFISGIDFPKNYNSNDPRYTSYNNYSIYVNRKIQRELAKNDVYNKNYKESKFSFDEEEPNKKRKLEITNNTIIPNSDDMNFSNNKVIFSGINNNNNLNNEIEKSFSNNSCFHLFNIRLNKEGETSLSLVKIIGNRTFFEYIPSEQINHKVPFLFFEKFPFLCSRLININNKAFIIGGISYFENNNCGNKFVFRLDYINNKNKRIGNINCLPLKETLFPHQSHHLIYSDLYNFIFVISGKEQKKCEYGIMDKEKKEINEWKEIGSVNKPRENAICFLFNEKYIFLFGDKNDNNNFSYYKYEYEVFNISLISMNKLIHWKTYQFISTKDNKSIFHIKISGIIEEDNNIYILGGYSYGLGNNLNYKISFINDENELENDYKIINTINNCEAMIKNEEILSFYGQQKFMEYQGKFHNINIQGKYMKFSQYDFDKQI